MSGSADVWVVPARLEVAGAAARTVADTVRGSDLAGPLRAVGAALPGSATAGDAPVMAGRWAGSASGLADLLQRHAASLVDAATSYAQSDHTVASALQPPHLPSPSPDPSIGQVTPGQITRALG